MGPINFVKEYLTDSKDQQNETDSEGSRTEPRSEAPDQFEVGSGNSVLASLEKFDRGLVKFVSHTAIPLLRVSLGVIYIWFGALKIFEVSPITDLVEKTAFLIPRKIFVKLEGLLEIVVGFGLLFRAALRLTRLFFFFQLGGTFMTIFIHPQEIFRRGNPLLLTKDGEFVLKNLVLLSAGLVIGSTARRESEKTHHTPE
jgi:uncharacterized membrane protein YkgB